MMIALAVFVGLCVIAFAVDYGTGRIVQQMEKVVLLLSRDVQERSEERIVRIEREERSRF